MKVKVIGLSLYPEATAQRLCEVALAEVGYIETPDNITKYGEFTKANGLAWCGSFVNWCAHQAGVKLPNTLTFAGGQDNVELYIPISVSMRALFKNKIRIAEFTYLSFYTDLL